MFMVACALMCDVSACMRFKVAVVTITDVCEDATAPGLGVDNQDLVFSSIL